MGSPLSYISFPFSTPPNLNTATGILALSNGGLGVSLTAPITPKILYYNSATNQVEWLGFGSGLVVSGGSVSAPTGGGGDLISTNNLADLDDIPTALGNLGVGSAGLQPSSAFVPSSAVSAFALTLLDDTNAANFRTTLGLNTAAQSPATDFVASTSVSAFALTFLDDANASTVRTTLGLGTASTYDAGTANGVALLDSGGKLDPAYIPTSLLGDNQFQTAWDASTNTPAIPAASAGNKGHFYIASSSCEIGHGYSNVPNVDFRTGDWVLSDGTSWMKIDHTDAVVTVAGRIGNVTLDTNDISGLGTAAVEDVGVANGVAPLDASSFVPEANLPATVKDRLHFVSYWDCYSNAPAIPPASAANIGHFYISIEYAQGGGLGHPNIPDLDYNLGDWLISNGTAWEHIVNINSIESVQNLATNLAAKVNAASPSTTGSFTHTGASNLNTSFTQVADGRFLSTNNSTGRTAGFQNAVFSTIFDSANTNQVGLEVGFTHTSGNATTTNKFTPLQGSIGGSQKMSYGLDIVPSTTWTGSGDVKAKLSIYIGGAVGAGFGIDTGAGTRRYFLRSNSTNEFGIVIPDNTNYNIVLPNAQGAAGSVLTNDGSGNTTWTVPSVTVTGFTPSDNTASPNNTVNASRLLANATSSNADFVLSPKGTGSILASLPDNAASGGNKRGTYALDLQLSRAGNTQVGSGNYSVTFGQNNTASGTNSVSIGQTNVASGSNSTALGASNTASGTQSVAIGAGNTASQSGAVALGTSCTASAANATAFGNSNTAGAVNSTAMGYGASTHTHNQLAIGSSLSTTGDSQTSILHIRVATSGTTPANLLASGSGGGNHISVASGRVIQFIAKGIAKNHTTGDIFSFIRYGAIKNIGGTTSLVGSIGTLGTDIADAAMSTCSVAITADNGSSRLQVQVTGISGADIRWSCSLHYTEVAS